MRSSFALSEAHRMASMHPGIVNYTTVIKVGESYINLCQVIHVIDHGDSIDITYTRGSWTLYRDEAAAFRRMLDNIAHDVMRDE